MENIVKVGVGSVAGKGIFELIKNILKRVLDGDKEKANETVKEIIRILQLLVEILNALDRLQD